MKEKDLRVDKFVCLGSVMEKQQDAKQVNKRTGKASKFYHLPRFYYGIKI
jgi:hypothetical protein